jgi:hypothetical protein
VPRASLFDEGLQSPGHFLEKCTEIKIQEDEMNLKKPLYLAAAVIVMSLAVGVMSQGLIDGIKVTLPHPVTVGEQVLQPGEYEIRRATTATDQVLRIYSNDEMRYETTVITIPTLDQETPEESKVVLHHIGDKYYFDKIWMQGKNYGYEFVLPEKVQSLQRELAVTVPATFQPAPAQSEQAAQADQPPAAQPERAAEVARQSETDSAGLAERERQAQLEREQQERLERERIAGLQTEQRPAPTSPQPRAAAQQPAEPRAAEQESAEGQLPATASNWLGFVLGGVLLLTLSIFLRQSRQES